MENEREKERDRSPRERCARGDERRAPRRFGLGGARGMQGLDKQGRRTHRGESGARDFARNRRAFSLRATSLITSA